MKDKKKAFGLASFALDAPAPVLTGVQANGRLDGLLFELTLRQTYRNASPRVLEMVYTFPLPVQAVLLGFASELNGERKVGTIVAKHEAERRYEKALAEGDAPVMLEALADGLHTANIGDLKPGDEIVLEVRLAQMLAFEQGRLRLVIPTTIAPRYGGAEQAGLQPQQTPLASLQAEYPLALSVAVSGVLAGGNVDCPTHRFTRQALDGGLRLDLDAGAWLDRDVVIVVTPGEPRPSLVIQAQDTAANAAPVVVMAVLQPPPTAPRQRVALKLLVDCSGSMGGDSIASARVALHGVLAGLTEHDVVSVSRFGSKVHHAFPLAACTPHALRHLQHAIDAIEADLGGTEMEAALKAVFELPMPVTDAGADVLLVTDGEIWQAKEMIAAARASGHRVFAIGVGTSPAEAVLRSLAEATGGACEFATPGENLEAAAARMLARVRQTPWREARMDWGSEPVWQTALPASVFGGDTVIAFAGMPALVSVQGVRLLASDPDGSTTELARGEADAPCPGDTLPRMAAARRMAAAGEPEALQLALAYQLMSRQTNCVLVHQRADADKATEEAELHRVSSMLAAGWGATSKVLASAQHDYSGLSTPSVWRSARSQAAAKVDLMFSQDADASMPLFSRTQPVDLPPATLAAMAAAVVEHLAQGHDVEELAAHCKALELHADARAALDQVVALGFSEGQAWLLLAHWVCRRAADATDPAAAAALQPHLNGIGADRIERCMKLFDRWLGGYASDGWKLSRAARLERAATAQLPRVSE
ncbi:MAG: VWA domain-containing protein [Novosphingobium sp.]|nr:VWA domain-containing protein [Novosphingobium sp.]